VLRAAEVENAPQKTRQLSWLGGGSSSTIRGKYPTVNPRLSAHGFCSLNRPATQDNGISQAGKPVGAQARSQATPANRIPVVDDEGS